MMDQHQFAPKLYYQLSLDQLVPQDHLLRQIQRTIDFSFIYPLAKPYYSYTGQPSVDPVIIFKTLLIGYLYGITSERRLMADIQVNLAYRWFLGYDLDENIPDHSVLSKARVRFGMAVFEKFFEHSIESCRKAGLLDRGPIFVDSTLIKAAASLDSLVNRDETVNPPLSAREYVQRLYTENESSQENNTPSPADSQPPNSGSNPSPPADLREPSPNSRFTRDKKPQKSLNHARVSQTDPEASILWSHKMGVELAYKAHMAVSGKAGQVITAAVVTPGAVNEEHLLQEVLNRHHHHTGIAVKEVVADAKYGTIDNYIWLQGEGLVAYIPPHERNVEPEGKWGKDRFRYLKEQDVFICPAGKTMRRMPWKLKKRVIYKVARGTCRNCAMAQQCTSGNLFHRDRITTRLIHQELVEEAKERLASPGGEELFKQRKTRIEGIFATGKELHGLRKTRFFGRWKVQLQVWMIASVINIKRVVKAMLQISSNPRNSPPGLPRLGGNAVFGICQATSFFLFIEIQAT